MNPVFTSWEGTHRPLKPLPSFRDASGLRKKLPREAAPGGMGDSMSPTPCYI